MRAKRGKPTPDDLSLMYSWTGEKLQEKLQYESMKLFFDGRLPYILGAVALVTLAFGTAYFSLTQSRTVTITRTEHGFEPERVYIKAGDTVRFVSSTGAPFWPASDSHPTHGLYPEFDSQRALNADESWSFTFKTPGVWNFHDHMESAFSGTIIVRGAPGESVQKCLEQKSGDAGIFPECWEDEVVQRIEDAGLPAAFEYIDATYAVDPLFRRNCHDVMHAVGRAAYGVYAASSVVTDQPQTTYCGYGFYHGFIEEMQTFHGVDQFSEVREYCEELETIHPGTRGVCYHGVGHAAFDSLSASAWGKPTEMVSLSLASCKRAALDEDARSFCSSGVYNSYANAMSAKDYKLSFDDFELIPFCDAQPSPYRSACYGELGIGYIRAERMDRDGALEFILGLDADLIRHLLYIYISDEVKRYMDSFDPQTFSATCTSLASYEQQSGCVEGVLQGIREETQHDQGFRLQFSYCAVLPEGAVRDYCLEHTASGASMQVQALPEFKQLCRELGGAPSCGE